MDYWQILGYQGRVLGDYLSEDLANTDCELLNGSLQTDEYRVVKKHTDKVFTNPIHPWWNGKNFSEQAWFKENGN